MVITAITGAAGVGKTALAVRWAHRVRDRFPDGQLYVDLRGYATGPPLPPLDALAGFLQVLGVPAGDVPVEVEQAAAAYRSLLTGRRVLVLLDNASHPDQVRPLLPASPGCLVLVTSRDRLTGLVARDGAVRLALDVLTSAEGRALLALLLGADRVHAEPEAAAELAELCGYLPLALRIAAATLTAHPRGTVAGYVAALRRDRLGTLQVAGDPHAALRTAFDHSLAALPAAARRLFALLGLLPGPDVTAEAAAALAGVPAGQAPRLLGHLAAAHLIEEHLPGRYAMHDLLRIHAAEQDLDEPGGSGQGDAAAPGDTAAGRGAALARLCDFYLRGVAGAADRLYPQVLRLPPPDAAPAVHFDGPAQALAWLDAERANLVAAVRHTAEHGPRQAAWRLADALRGYLYARMHVVDWTSVARAGLAAAEAGGDPGARAAAHLSLATLHWAQDRYQQAIDHYTPALALARRAGWVEGESAALGNLGAVYTSLGRLEQAAEHYRQALAIDQRTGWLAGQSAKLANLGILYREMGRLELATEHYHRALALDRLTRSPSGEARTLASLGTAYHALGRLGDALATLTRALDVHRATGDRNIEGDTVRMLAAVHRDAGRHAEALDLARAALDLARETGDRHLEVDAGNVCASVYHHLGRHAEAVECHQRALHLARDIAAPYVQAETLVGLADAHTALGHHRDAAAHAHQALAIARDAGYRLLEGSARTALAANHLGQGDAGPALEQATHALAIHTETGHLLGQARTHLVAERALRATGGDGAARDHRRRALALLAETGAVLPRSPAARQVAPLS